MNRFRTLAVTVVAGFALVACGPAASSSADPSSEASAAGALGGGVLPSFTARAVADLEALIPDTVGDLRILKQSMEGNEFLTAPGSDADLIKFVEDLGVSPDDIFIAVGISIPADASAPPKSLFMFIFRATHVETSRLLSVFKAATDSSRDAALTWSSDEVGGKSVEVAVDSGERIYLYAKDDTLFFVSGDPDSSAEVISGLP